MRKFTEQRYDPWIPLPDRDVLELHVAGGGAGEVPFDLQGGIPVAERGGGVVKVFDLGRKESISIAAVTVRIISTAVVGDEDGAAQPVGSDQEVKLVAQQAVLDEAGAAAIGEPGRPTGEGQAVVVRELQVTVQELVDVVAVAAIAAVDGDRVDAPGLEPVRT